MFRSREELALEEANKAFSRHKERYIDSDLSESDSFIILCAIVLAIGIYIACNAR